MGIINRIRNRIDKTWQPKTVQGSLHRHYSADTIDMSKGEWLVLARTKYLIKRYRRIFVSTWTLLHV